MINIDLWLYGRIAKYGGSADQGSHANLTVQLAENATMQDLLSLLGFPPEEKGITFINRQLSDMPGLAADLDRGRADGDRVAIFHTGSMWPFQYRHEVAAIPEMQKAMRQQEGGLHHDYH
jgi:hypothetical protein